MVIRHDIGTPPAGDDRDLQQFGEPQQVGRRPGAKNASTGEDDRPFGRCQQFEDLSDVGVSGSTGGRALGRDARIGRYEFVEQVFRERQQHRSRSSTGDLSERLRQHAGYVGGVGRLRGPLGQAADRADLVDLLEGLVPPVGPFDLTDEREHRRGVLASRVDADRQVRCADRARTDARSGPPGQVAMRLGHEGGSAFVTCRDHPDPRPVEPVEQSEE